jgi:hypothetical protein
LLVVTLRIRWHHFSPVKLFQLMDRKLTKLLEAVIVEQLQKSHFNSE